MGEKGARGVEIASYYAGLSRKLFY